MKNTILIFFALLAMAQSSIAQSTDTVTFQITISNPNAISYYTNSGLPVFSNTYNGINSILSAYNVTQFKQTFPTARSPYLRKIYSVRCNSMALAAALKSADSALFPAYAQKRVRLNCLVHITPTIGLYILKKTLNTLARPMLGDLVRETLM